MALEAVEATLPVVWLLGKTGAGKSSLVQNLTGLSTAEVGNGFEPCTRTAAFFDFPAATPVMRFLDTRGLGEAGYDPTTDLAECESHSHAILAVARLDDPVQGALSAALRTVVRRAPDIRVIVVHTGADLLPDEQERARARAATQNLLQTATGRSLPAVELSQTPSAKGGGSDGVAELITLLGQTMPEVALLLARADLRDAERAAFAKNKPDVLWYASAAGSSDIAPVVGAVAVPAVQAAMLRMLGNRYGVEWTRTRMAEFAAALGLGTALRFGASYVTRQVAKLIPVVGQTAGAAAAGTISFAATYALGRAAAYYLHRTQIQQAVTPADLRAVFQDALKGARNAPR
ncbi:hypothetical protein BV911_12065 [Pseudoruegeria sp. SK021]|nr:hypothetical protein BV911_12065 [Pseudoruegeria sp. SK021]